MDVVSGEVVAGPHVRGAARRHLEDQKRADIVWDATACDRAIAFFETVLCLAGGDFEGKPFLLEPWQAFCVGALFGWKRLNGQRRFRWAYIETGKGSGKSPLAAGIGHYMLMADGEARAEVYAAATKKDQAMILFRDAVAMFQQSSELKQRLIPSGSNPIWQLTYLHTASFFKAIADDDGKSGPRPSCALVDEVHEHKDGHTIEMLEAGFKFRKNPMMVMITNSGSDRTSVCWKYHDLVERICAGDASDDEVFGYVCALDEGDDPFEDESCWPKANPSLGVTIRHDYLRSRVEKARNLPDKRNEVLRLNFCVWTDADAAWLTRPVWMAVQKTFDVGELAGRKAWIGLDLSRRKDLTAGSVIVENGQRQDADGKRRRLFKAFTQFWTPSDGIIDKESEDNQPYRRWVEEGHIIAPPGKFVRYEFVADWLIDMSEVFDLQAVAYDQYAIRELETVLDDLGVDLPLVEHPQGFRRAAETELWMPSSIDGTEELIAEGLIEVLPNPCLTWNVASAMFEHDAQGNRKLSKRKSTGRIDGTVSLVMGGGCALNAPEPPAPSVYASRGALVL